MLLTRSPLSPKPKPRFSLDLHVLSAPPAFVLSQDQTLREETDCPTVTRTAKRVGINRAGRKGVSLRALTTFARNVVQRRHRPVPPGRQDGSDGIDDIDLLRRQAGRNRHDVASRRTRTLLSFQGSGPEGAGNKKASARARGLQIDGLRKVVSDSSGRRSWSVAGLLSPPSRAAGGV